MSLIQYIMFTWPEYAILLLMLSLVGAAMSREETWAPFVWFQPVVVLGSMTFILGKKAWLAIVHMPGPNAGADGAFAAMTLYTTTMPALFCCIVGLFFCYLVKPLRSAHWPTPIVTYGFLLFCAELSGPW